MSKKITALAIAILVSACSIVMVGHSSGNGIADVSNGKVNSHAAKETLATVVMDYIPSMTMKKPGTTTLGELVSDKMDYVTVADGIISDVAQAGNDFSGMLDIGGIIGGGSDSDSNSVEFSEPTVTSSDVADMPIDPGDPGNPDVSINDSEIPSSPASSDSFGGSIGSGSVGSIIGNGLGSVDIGGVIGGLGGAIGGVISGVGNDGILPTTPQSTYNVNTETAGYIDIVPAASQYVPVVPSQQATVPVVMTPSTTKSSNLNETVDFAADNNPYQRPTTVLKGGDTGEGVKWMQWIFIYTRYGLKDDGITGVFDEDTMAVVKKLQKENGFTVDGVVDDKVIDKIELLYFQAVHTTAEEETETKAVVTTAPAEESEKGLTDGLTILLVAVIAIWIIAIGFLGTMFVMKKKKASKNKKSNGTKVQNNNDKVEEQIADETEISVDGDND